MPSASVRKGPPGKPAGVTSLIRSFGNSPSLALHYAKCKKLLCPLGYTASKFMHIATDDRVKLAPGTAPRSSGDRGLQVHIAESQDERLCRSSTFEKLAQIKLHDIKAAVSEPVR